MKLFIEGGGRGKDLKSELRTGFASFLRKAGFEGRSPKIVASGGRADVFDDYQIETRSTRAMLLLDSEAPVTVASPWRHLAEVDGWHTQVANLPSPEP